MSTGLLIAALALGPAACTFDVEELEVGSAALQPELALPIVQTRVTLGDVLGAVDLPSTLRADRDGRLRYVLRAPVLSVRPARYVALPDLTLPVIDTATRTPLAEAGFTELAFAADRLRVDLVNESDRPVRTVITSPHVAIDARPLRVEVDLAAGQSIGRDIRLAEGYLRADAAGDVVLRAQTTYADDAPAPTPRGTLAFTQTAFLRGAGDFGDLTISAAGDSAALEFVPAALPGVVRVLRPRAELHLRNETPLPLSARSPRGFAYGATGQQLPLRSRLDDPVAIPPSRGGVPGTVTVPLGPDDSNLEDVLNAFPEGLLVDFAIETRPPGPDPAATQGDALLFDQELTGEIVADFPLVVELDGLRFTEVLPVDLDFVDDATAATLVVETSNSLAASARLGFGFRAGPDSPATYLLADAAEPLLRAPELDAAGAVVSPGIQRLEIEVDAATLRAIGRAEEVVVDMRFDSPATGTRATDLRLGAAVDLRAALRFTREF